MTFSLRRAIKLEARPIGAASALVLLLVSVCIGLLITSAIAITMLFIQIKDMKMEIGQWERSLLATTARLNQVEKIAKDRSNEKQILLEVSHFIPRLRWLKLTCSSSEST